MSDFISGIFSRHKNEPSKATEEESTDTSAPVYGGDVATIEATSEVAPETDVFGAEPVADETTDETTDESTDVTTDVATDATTEIPAVDPLSDPEHVIVDSEAAPAGDVAELAESETAVGSDVVGEVAEPAPVEASVDQVDAVQVETEDAFGTQEGEVTPAVDAEADTVGVDAAAVAEGETIFGAEETVEAPSGADEETADIVAAPEGVDETAGAYDAASEGTEPVEAAAEGDVVSGDVDEDASADVEDTVDAVEPEVSDVDATDSDAVETDVEGTLAEETNVSEFGGATDTVEGEDVADELTAEVTEPAAEVESGDESPFATEAVVDEPAAEDTVITDAEDVETVDETVVEDAVETPEADVTASTETPADEALEVAEVEDAEEPVEAAYEPAEAELAEDTEVVEEAPVEEPVASVESAEVVATEDTESVEDTSSEESNETPDAELTDTTDADETTEATAAVVDEAPAEDTIAEDVLVDEAPVAEETPAVTDSQVEDVETSDELLADADAEAATDEAATDEVATDEVATDDVTTDDVTTDEVATDEVATGPAVTEQLAPGFAPEPIVEQEPAANETLTGVLRVAREARGKSTVSEGLVERLVHHVVAKVEGVHAIDDEGTSVDIVGEIANITVSYVIAFGNPVKATAATIRTNVIEVVEDYFDIDVKAVDVNVSDFHDA